MAFLVNFNQSLLNSERYIFTVFYEPLINVNNAYVNFVTIVYNFEFSFLKTFDFVANRI